MTTKVAGRVSRVRGKLKALVQALHPATVAGLLILSVVSGYLNYLAAADLLSAGMVIWQGKTAAATVAIAVSTVIMLFWMYVFAFLPEVKGWKPRLGLFGVTGLGCAMILCLSCWMNAAALAGVRAQERDLASRLAAYSQAFDDVHRRALVVRQLLPFLDAEAGRFDGMSRSEKSTGALTGSVGSGAVAAILDQVAGRLLSLKGSVLESLKDAGQEADEAREHLKAMRDLLGAQGEFEKRLSEFADHAVALEALMARMSEQSVLPAIKQTAGALDSSLIMPATSSRSDALAGKQAAVMQGVSTAVREVGVRLADAAAEIEQQQPVSIPAFMPLSRAEAIVVYARDFLPAWAAAVSIDLMPLVIVLILTIVRASDPEDEPQGDGGRAPKRRGAEA